MPEMWNFEFFCVLCPIFSHPSAVCHTVAVSKMVEDRIVQLSPQIRPIPLIFAI